MALEKAGLTSKDVQLAELNEAFACVAALAIRELGLDPDIVNVNGGAVALGHPLGNTGTRMIVTLIHELADSAACRSASRRLRGRRPGRRLGHQGRRLIHGTATIRRSAPARGSRHRRARAAPLTRKGEHT